MKDIEMKKEAQSEKKKKVGEGGGTFRLQRSGEDVADCCADGHH